VEEKEMENFEPQNFVPLVESEEFLGEVAVAEIAEDQAEESFEVLLGETNVDAIVRRVAEPSHTRVDFSKSESVGDRESFDGSDDILSALDAPEPSTYIAPPQRVEKDGLDRDLLKAARRGPTLTAWIKSELSRGAKIEDLVSHARAVDPKIAGDIEGCYLLMTEQSDEE
jgi:hypothetical protein